MPRADPRDQLPFDPNEAPSVQLEAMGRGPQARKSKSLMPNIELAMTLGLVKRHKSFLVDLFRQLHAAHHKVQAVDEDGLLLWVMEPEVIDGQMTGRKVPVLDEDGKPKPLMVPEELTDSEVMEKYTSCQDWEDFHQEQVEHYPSVGGFSTKAALGYDDTPNKKGRGKDSSSGSEHTERRRRWS